MSPEDLHLIDRVFDLFVASLPVLITAAIGAFAVIKTSIINKKTAEKMKEADLKSAEETEKIKKESELVDDLSTDLNNLRAEVRALRKDLQDLSKQHYAAQKYIFNLEVWIAKGMPTPPGPPERPSILDQ